ncbi:MAG TPA: hypothetical protein VF834_25825 [Streptosporangiaceae bacterium]
MNSAVRYGIGGWYRVLMLAMFAIFGIVAVLLVVAASGGHGGVPVLFIMMWIVIIGGNGYFSLFRVAYELEFDGERLRWRAPLRSGEVPLSGLTRIRAVRSSFFGAIDGAREGRVLVLAGKGFTEFSRAVVVARPELPVQIGFRARLAERMPGRSRFRGSG